MNTNHQWNFKETSLKGVCEIQPFCAYDIRGFFLKDYSDEIFRQNDLDYELKETFYSFSNKNVIRGLHFQRCHQMPKLVRCLKGSISDVVCDLRKGSPDFGKWISIILSEENMKELLIPGGFAHGFMALEDSLVSYKCSETFYKEFDDGIVWNDPDINVDWKLDNTNNIIISEKDSHLQTLKEFIAKYKGLEY